jgi:hypothetical protein
VFWNKVWPGCRCAVGPATELRLLPVAHCRPGLSCCGTTTTIIRMTSSLGNRRRASLWWRDTVKLLDQYKVLVSVQVESGAHCRVMENDTFNGATLGLRYLSYSLWQ